MANCLTLIKHLVYPGFTNLFTKWFSFTLAHKHTAPLLYIQQCYVSTVVRGHMRLSVLPVHY